MSSPSTSSSTATPTPHQQYALSRNEEAKVLAECKIDALRHCEVETATFSECAQGRTVSVAWKCRNQFRVMQACMAVQQVFYLYADSWGVLSRQLTRGWSLLSWYDTA